MARPNFIQRPISGLLCLWVVLLLPGFYAFGETLWIDDAPGGSGTGDQAHPFHWGNSPDSFDTGMRAAGSGATVYLRHVQGTTNLFQTRGAYANSINLAQGFQFKSEQKILGGPGVTIQLVYVVPAANPGLGFNIVLGAISSFFTHGATANGVLLQDLLIDCNGMGLKNQRTYSTVRGIELAGTQNTLRNVTVIHAIDDRSLIAGYDENFIISLSTYEAASSGNLIDRCTVKDFIVDKSNRAATNVMCSAISLRVIPKGTNSAFTISGSVQNCSVVLNGFGPGVYPDQEYALNGSFMAEVAMTGNVIVGATRGFNNDAGPNRCLFVAGNTFEQAGNSCAVFISSSSDSILRANTIKLRGGGSIAIKVQGLDHGQQAIRWRITGNTIHSFAKGNSGIYFYPAPRNGSGMPSYMDVEGNLFTGRPCYIHVPSKPASASNYIAANIGAFRYFTPMAEPVGVPCSYPNLCHLGW